jgi:CubicO group peptidase (beta-lactamase class C family)
MTEACSTDFECKIDRLFRDYQGDVPGAAVMAIRHGQPVLVKSYGLADYERHIPVTDSTNFRLASLTKQFTAMSIMILKERGKLDYTQTLCQIFPEFPAYGKDITIRNLLQHTSGLIDYENLIPESAIVQVRDRDVLRMMMAQDSTDFIPGSAFRYSNSGYAVLAMVVEKVSGQSFAAFLKENIFLPLGMHNSVAFEEGISIIPNRAYGYNIEDDSVTFSDQSMTSAVLGDGGIYTSVNDLFKWDQALYSDKLVSKETLDEAFTPALDGYGFGWWIDSYKGYKRIRHYGSTCSFRTAILRYPEDEFTVIILTNRREPDVTSLAEKVTDIYLL